MELKKILIIEDEKPFSRVLDLKLTNAGFKTKVAHDGNQAIDIINKENFDLIILDLILPIKSGFDVMEEINNREIKTPVIILSNLSQKDDKERVASLANCKYFVKSDISMKDLISYIKKI